MESLGGSEPFRDYLVGAQVVRASFVGAVGLVGLVGLVRLVERENLVGPWIRELVNS